MEGDVLENALTRHPLLVNTGPSGQRIQKLENLVNVSLKETLTVQEMPVQKLVIK